MFILVAVITPRWVDGRWFGGFQPIFGFAVVDDKYGSLCWWFVSKKDGSSGWEFVLKSKL